MEHDADQLVLGGRQWQITIINCVIFQLNPPLSFGPSDPVGLDVSEIGLVGVAPPVTVDTPVEQDHLLLVDQIPGVTMAAYKCHTKITLDSYELCAVHDSPLRLEREVQRPVDAVEDSPQDVGSYVDG